MRFLILFSALYLSAPASAQAPGVKIFDQSREALKREDQKLGVQAEALMKAGTILTHESVLAAMKKPDVAKTALKAPLKTALEPTEISAQVLPSIYRIGWAYLCPNCDNWHTKMAGGYAISDDGIIATCAHVVDPDGIKMRQGCLIAVNHKGTVFPVTKVIAFHDAMDAALIRITGKTKGLALNDQVSPGDAAFCLSRPLSQGKYFSTGIVNRFYWNSAKRGNDDTAIRALAHLKMNVSSRWAPGSSGSPVLDQAGNVIGHVATIRTMGSKNPEKKNTTYITLHSATPARSVMTLAKKN